MDGHDVKYANISNALADALDASVLVTVSWAVARKMTHVLSVDRMAIEITAPIHSSVKTVTPVIQHLPQIVFITNWNRKRSHYRHETK